MTFLRNISNESIANSPAKVDLAKNTPTTASTSASNSTTKEKMKN